MREMIVDQPFFSAPPTEEEIDGARIEVRAPRVPDITPVERLRAQLMQSSEWGDQPCVADQEFLFPETVRIEEVTTKTFDFRDKGDEQLFSSLELSNGKRGRLVFLRGPELKFVETTGSWKAFCVYATRKFKLPGSTKPEKKPAAEDQPLEESDENQAS